MDLLLTALEQYLETFPYTKWTSYLGYRTRSKDAHAFCGYIPHASSIQVIVRATKSQMLKAKRQYSYAKPLDDDPSWLCLHIDSLNDLQSLQTVVDQAYAHTLTLKSTQPHTPPLKF